MPTVTRFDVDANGNLINCAPTSATPGSSSRFLVFNDNETLAYITNAASDNVSKCQVTATGTQLITR
ncbi:Uncharacterised protein [Legionella steigerwaltii]|uniref:Uncharacterized protein n=1 Tax=Legionella steigerwaltii TaxID=460 RepID=A0A378LC62_9GAMM|nr:beta-propeller fold lactonase family protein [Legionella steigerwaltii]KTD80983.1 hypothetical protein Lstg_0210 [Legionella steigerwaltii]STY23329.1 Uncharacterised protein [Legionella steigerwaltii]